MKNIVVIGGGTGTSLVLSGLKNYRINLSAVISTADNGGSTGILRKTYGGLPVGDIRACLLALSSASSEVKKMFALRFEKGDLAGHVFGNLFLALSQKSYGINQAIADAAKILKVRREVIPVSQKATTLSAVLQNGRVITGEHNINEHEKPVKIVKVKLSPARANPAALSAIKKADLIVFAPGDIFTSILPNLLVPRIAAAISKSKAKKVMVVNFLRQKGHTDDFQIHDFVQVLEKYLRSGIDVAIVNTERPKVENASFIKPDIKPMETRGVRVMAKPLLSKKIFKKSKADKLKRNKVRYDERKLGKVIYNLLS